MTQRAMGAVKVDRTLQERAITVLPATTMIFVKSAFKPRNARGDTNRTTLYNPLNQKIEKQ